jgi:DNA-binding NarL/FixJ family response regulator
MTIRVAVVDDQPLMRVALGMSLAAEDDIEMVGEAADGLEALALIDRLEPDVVVMDIRMPRLDGIAVTRRLTESGHGRPPRVLIMTTFDLDEYVIEALRAGASGFVLKDATSEDLVRAVRVVARGEALLAPAVTRRLLDRFARRLPPAASAATADLSQLTSRELAVLRLVAQGLSNAAIGASMHLAESSVKTHVSHVLAKLGKHDRVQLVITAYEAGLVEPSGGLLPSDRAGEPRALP